MLRIMCKWSTYKLRSWLLKLPGNRWFRWLLVGAAPKILSKPKTMSELLYQTQSGFVSKISIGGAAPDGPAHTLDGAAVTLLDNIDPNRLTIINFGSCT